MNFETVIGLEVHVELNTNSKIFSPAPAHFGAGPNENTNIVDWSFPGVLPVMNKGVIESGIKAALALNMDIHQNMHFDRKNYFYPDNPKAYQISQFDEPIGYNGWIEIELGDGNHDVVAINWGHVKVDENSVTVLADGAVSIGGSSESEIAKSLDAAKELLKSIGDSDIAIAIATSRIEAITKTRKL